MTPLKRGFDEFRGSYSPMLHYFDYNYLIEKNNRTYGGIDLWINEQAVTPNDTNGQYLTDWEGEQFMDILDNHTTSHENEPFFLYMAMHSSHDPREATNECLSLYYSTDCVEREFDEFMRCGLHQTMQAQTSCADQTTRQMFEHLQQLNDGKIWENTLVIWLSDNGVLFFFFSFFHLTLSSNHRHLHGMETTVH